jgi:hypothetical protein
MGMNNDLARVQSSCLNFESFKSMVKKANFQYRCTAFQIQVMHELSQCPVISTHITNMFRPEEHMCLDRPRAMHKQLVTCMHMGHSDCTRLAMKKRTSSSTELTVVQPHARARRSMLRRFARRSAKMPCFASKSRDPGSIPF